LSFRYNKADPGENFNSRFMAIDRHYRYRIQTSPSDPLRGRYVHEYGRKLDIESMQQASKLLLGTHDFLAFTEEIPFSGTNTVRKLFRFDVREVRDEVWVDVVGTAFLRGMMRRMSGALLEVGRGYRNVEEVSRLLQREERHNLQWPVVLPAKGLCLQKIRYGRNPRDIRSTALSNEIDLEEQ
jgi:tRNA pseudouridine38-40 synthase